MVTRAGGASAGGRQAQDKIGYYWLSQNGYGATYWLSQNGYGLLLLLLLLLLLRELFLFPLEECWW